MPITTPKTRSDDVKPELGDSWFAEADGFIGDELVQRGRPRVESPKQPISLRVDQEVVDWFKLRGSGWQTRMNEALRRAAGL